jgi:glycosyltransferase involved in cell wall biosynthesis
MKDINIITIVNKVSETSMPVNEFVKFRQNNFDEQGMVFSLSEIVDTSRKAFRSIEMYSLLKKPMKFIDILRNDSINIVHTHQPRSAFFVTLLALIIPKKISIVSTVHNNFTKFNSVNKLVIIFNSFFAKNICFVSESSYNSFPSFLKKRWKDKLHTTTNGVDINRVDEFIALQSINKVDTDRVELIHVGKLEKQKNQEQLLRIMSKLPDNFHLTIVGAGSEEKNILEGMKNLGIANKITMTGLVPREDVYGLLVNSKIFINPALWEGMPIGVLEAMTCSLPVLLSDIPPHKELVTNSVENFICETDEKFIQKIVDYANLNTEDLEKIGASNRQLVDDYYSLNAMHKKYDAVYCASVE